MIDLDLSSSATGLSQNATATGQRKLLHTTSSEGLQATNQIYYDEQTFDGTTNGIPAGSAQSTPYTPANGHYEIPLDNGTAVNFTVLLPSR